MARPRLPISKKKRPHPIGLENELYQRVIDQTLDNQYQNYEGEPKSFGAYVRQALREKLKRDRLRRKECLPEHLDILS